MDEERTSGFSEHDLTGGAPPPVPPSPSSAAPGEATGRRLDRSHVPGIVAIVGAAAIIVGSVMSWNTFVVGPLTFTGKTGIRAGSHLWVLLLAALLIFRSIALLRGQAAFTPGARLGGLITCGVILFIAIRYALVLRDELTTWVLGTASAQIARDHGIAPATVTAALRSWLDSGQSHLSLSFGYWLVVGGALVAAGATIVGEVMGRRAGSPAPDTPLV